MKYQFFTKGVLQLSLIYSLLCTHASAQWTVQNLHPAGADSSSIYGLSATNQVGSVFISGSSRAALWSGSAVSFVNLHPAGSSRSELWATTGTSVYGTVRFPSLNDNGLVWNLTTGTTTNLQPSGAVRSRVFGASGLSQAGTAYAGSGDVASLWIGTSSSWVNLNPVGASSSAAYGVQGSRQVGTARMGDGYDRASLWNGTASSWLDLTPALARASSCKGISGNNQCGWVNFWDGGTGGGFPGLRPPVASAWSGTAASWLNLNPLSATESKAYAITGTGIVGEATIGGVTRASLWRGNAAGWVDIHPVGYASSTARAIRSDGTNYQIGGYGLNSFTGREEAILWTIPVNPITRNINGNLELQNTSTSGSGGNEAITWTLSNGVHSSSGVINVSRQGGGAYSFNIPLGWPTGTYLVRMKGGTFLSSAFLVTLADANVTMNASLRNGDIDQDGEVGPGDFEQVVAQFGDVGTADVDNDDEVGPSDFETVVANFGLQDE